MKYKQGNYHQKSNLAHEHLNKIKASHVVYRLWCHLVYLEHKLTGRDKDYFYHTIGQLKNDLPMGRRQIIEGIETLEKLKMLKTWQAHFEDKKGNVSVKHVTAFQLLY